MEWFYLVGTVLVSIGIGRFIIAFQLKNRAKTIKRISDNLSNNWRR
ncbi:hypothetical protein PL10110_700038 [Planktothrix agardhii]|jgi:hypothetical protein|nr:hypothetical protein PL10110_700038 [Planktothrix agardhii]CAD5935809.1 hypothetical protein PCC7821_01582 [Planktothrix rubescens NIVA-CYA 18]